jgi:hypothetical protein
MTTVAKAAMIVAEVATKMATVMADMTTMTAMTTVTAMAAAGKGLRGGVVVGEEHQSESRHRKGHNRKFARHGSLLKSLADMVLTVFPALPASESRY